MYAIDYMQFIVPPLAVFASTLLLAVKSFGECSWPWRRVLIIAFAILAVGFTSWTAAAYLTPQV